MTIVALKGVILPGEANDELVLVLEKLLAQARSGHLRGLAYATHFDSGATGTGWVESDDSLHPVAAAIMTLNHRYGAMMTERGSE
jgi:hypothetical protein